MKKNNKFMSFIVFFTIFMVIFSVPVSAAGRETWYGNWVNEPTMIITNNNLTPEKTMGQSGTLHIAASIKGRPDLEPSGCPKVKLTVEIRDARGHVLASGSTREDAFIPQVHLSLHVNKGQKVYVFFDVSSVSKNPNRNYRVGEVSYSHEIY